MKNQVQTFIFGFEAEATDVRVVLVEDQVWFVAADVCKALDLGNTAMALERVDQDEKGVSSIDTLGGPQAITIISEPGLYNLVLGSRKPQAKRFKRWVTHEVLPAIARTGVYIDARGCMAEALDQATDSRIKLDRDDPARTANLADMAGLFGAIAAINGTVGNLTDTVGKLAKEVSLKDSAANRLNRDMRRDFSRALAQLVRVNSAQRASNAGADPNRPLDDDEIERAKFLFASGESAKQIAKRLNRTHGAMARFIAENPALVVAAVQRPLL